MDNLLYLHSLDLRLKNLDSEELRKVADSIESLMKVYKDEHADSKRINKND
jgi:hypothetical protein